MRVLWVAPVLPAPFGAGTRTFYFLTWLARTCEIDLVAGASAAEPSGEILSVLDSACRSVTIVPQAVHSHRYKRLVQLRSLLSRLPAQFWIFYSRQIQEQIHRLVGETSYDLVVLESSFLGYYAVRSDAVKIVDQHNVESDVLLRSGQHERSRARRAYSRLEYWKFRSHEQRVCRKADLILAASRRDRDVMAAWGDIAPCAVIPNGVDTTYFAPADAEPAHGRSANVVFTGTMSYSPNVDAMLHFAANMWPRIRERVPEARLQIVGQLPSPEVSRLGELAAVTVTGAVPDVRPFLAEAAVVVAPLRMGGGTRVKILEAMAMGRPVVSTSVGCEGLDVEDNRHLLIADEPADFADQVVQLLSDGTRGDALGREGRRLVEEKYDWSAIGASMERAVREFLQTGEATLPAPSGDIRSQLERIPV